MDSEITLIPFIEVSGLPSEVKEELRDDEIDLHQKDSVFYVCWEDEDLHLPITQAWLLETFGNVIKKYDNFALSV